MVDIKYSQNLYKNKVTLKKIIKDIKLHNSDTVIEIGAGKGVITEELVKYCDNVIAYELDNKYFEILEESPSFHPANTGLNISNNCIKLFATTKFNTSTSILFSKVGSSENTILSPAFIFLLFSSYNRTSYFLDPLEI